MSSEPSSSTLECIRPCRGFDGPCWGWEEWPRADSQYPSSGAFYLALSPF